MADGVFRITIAYAKRNRADRGAETLHQGETAPHRAKEFAVDMLKYHRFDLLAVIAVDEARPRQFLALSADIHAL